MATKKELEERIAVLKDKLAVYEERESVVYIKPSKVHPDQRVISFDTTCLVYKGSNAGYALHDPEHDRLTIELDDVAFAALKEALEQEE